jgi:hypothetical protein
VLSICHHDDGSTHSRPYWVPMITLNTQQPLCLTRVSMAIAICFSISAMLTPCGQHQNPHPLVQRLGIWWLWHAQTLPAVLLQYMHPMWACTPSTWVEFVPMTAQMQCMRCNHHMQSLVPKLQCTSTVLLTPVLLSCKPYVDCQTTHNPVDALSVLCQFSLMCQHPTSVLKGSSLRFDAVLCCR